MQLKNSSTSTFATQKATRMSFVSMTESLKRGFTKLGRGVFMMPDHY